jgi:maltose/moltooligosaccharide transporter
MGAYLGLFNCAICLPQIVAAACGGLVFKLVGSTQTAMMFVACALLIIGSACVFAIRTANHQS